jgi:hypothetical protein
MEFYAKYGSYLLVALTLCGVGVAQQHPSPSTAATAFRDSADTPPPNWRGPRFKLSHDYPRQMPSCPAPWLKRPVSFANPSADQNDWRGYVQDIVDYIKEGQDPNLPDETGWQTRVGIETRWYHVPWMAVDGERGREFAHGLTNELSTSLSTFHEGRGSGKERIFQALQSTPGVDPLFETWSVGMYNPCGAWALGQVFPASGQPAVHMEGGRPFADGLPFPEGTVVIKILNTTADAASVPYLKGSTDWQADAHVQYSPVTYSTCERRVRNVHLIQIDLAVVDSRSPARWVYSTLAYYGNLPGASVLDRVQPLGVQWGNDPHTFPAVPRARANLSPRPCSHPAVSHSTMAARTALPAPSTRRTRAAFHVTWAPMQRRRPISIFRASQLLLFSVLQGCAWSTMLQTQPISPTIGIHPPSRLKTSQTPSRRRFRSILRCNWRSPLLNTQPT